MLIIRYILLDIVVDVNNKNKKTLKFVFYSFNYLIKIAVQQVLGDGA